MIVLHYYYNKIINANILNVIMNYAEQILAVEQNGMALQFSIQKNLIHICEHKT